MFFLSARDKKLFSGDTDLSLYIICFCAGTIFGSFFYTLALRYSDGSIRENPVKALAGRSVCPQCGSVVHAIYLIPVLGYFIARGGCRSCGTKISTVYPAMEILYGAIAVVTVHYLGADFVSFSYFLIMAVSVTIAVIDIKTMTVPVSLVIIFVILSIYPVIVRGNFISSLWGFLLLSLFFLVIMFIFPGSFGGGDLKFYAAAGILLGLEMSIVLLEVSLVIGAMFGVVYGLMHGKNFRVKIPFAPFIAAGIIITIIFGDSIILFYYRNIYSF